MSNGKGECGSQSNRNPDVVDIIMMLKQRKLYTCIYMSQDMIKRTFWQLKSKVRYLQRKKDLALANNYRKFEEIIFTNNEDMSILTRIDDAL